MKSIILVMIISLFSASHLFAAPWDNSESTRYEIRSHAKFIFLLDRKTGRTWILNDARGGFAWQPLTVTEKPMSVEGSLMPGKKP